jgi:hypothetical protein
MYTLYNKSRCVNTACYINLGLHKVTYSYVSNVIYIIKIGKHSQRYNKSPPIAWATYVSCSRTGRVCESWRVVTRLFFFRRILSKCCKHILRITTIYMAMYFQCSRTASVCASKRLLTTRPYLRLIIFGWGFFKFGGNILHILSSYMGYLICVWTYVLTARACILSHIDRIWSPNVAKPDGQGPVQTKTSNTNIYICTYDSQL